MSTFLLRALPLLPTPKQPSTGDLQPWRPGRAWGDPVPPVFFVAGPAPGQLSNTDLDQIRAESRDRLCQTTLKRERLLGGPITNVHLFCKTFNQPRYVPTGPVTAQPVPILKEREGSGPCVHKSGSINTQRDVLGGLWPHFSSCHSCQYFCPLPFAAPGLWHGSPSRTLA